MRRLKRILILIILLPMLLLASCLRLPSGSRPTETPGASSDTPSPVPTDWHSGVKTDYSGLTPYVPPEENYTRLSDGALPELMPSDQYGTLLPYIGEVMYSYGGYNTVRQYGLVTADGMIVTDAVYNNVYQGSYFSYSTYTSKNVPVYNLVKLSETIDEENPWDSEIHAVCAVDGGWTTSFDYKSVYFTDKEIILVRDPANNDIDVLDYNGKLLYNTKSLACFDELPEYSAYKFMDGYGEGLIAIPLTSGQSVLIDALTGAETTIDYESCSAFSGGRAAVLVDGLYGYIDRDLNLVIPPQFVWFDYFYHGKGVVQYPDQSYAIIDTDGNVLLENENYISKWDTDTYGIYNADNSETYYDSDLNKISFDGQQITPLSGGWYFFMSGKDITIFKGSETHTFEDVEGIYGITNGLVVVYSSTEETYREGVMTLDGQTVVPMADGQSIYMVDGKKAGETYIIASTYGADQTFKVFDQNGTQLFSGGGYVLYNADYGVFQVDGDYTFAYVDAAGSDIFRISLLRYLPD